MADPPARTKTTAKTARRQPAKAIPAQSAPPAGVTPDDADDEPRYVGDQRVVKDEPLLSPLGKVNGKQVTFHSYRVWTLEDGTRVHACARCYDYTGSRGDVRKHLVAEHGMKNGGNTGKQDTNTAAVTNFMSLSMAEVVELVQSSGQWGEMLDAAETAAADWKERALTAEAENKRFRNTFDRLGFVPKEND